MAAISLCCPKCETILKMANAPAEGKKVKCPKCAALFVAADHEVVKGSTAVTAKPDLPMPAKKRPRDEDEDDESPRRRKARADDDEQEDDDAPRRGKAKRQRDDDEDDDRPRRPIKKKKQKSNAGLIIGLCIGGGALAVLTVAAGGLFWLLSGAPARPVAKAADAQAPAVQQVAANPIAKAPAAPAVQNPVVPVAKEAPIKPKREPKTPKKKAPNPPPPPPPDPVAMPEPLPVAGPVDLDKNLLAKTSAATALIRVSLGSQGATGSGFIVKSSGDTAYIITNYHVIALDREDAAPPPKKGKGGPKKAPGSPFPKGGPKRVPFQGLPGFGPQAAPKQQQPKESIRVTVVLYSGTPQEQEVAAQIVSVDEESDLAALRINGARNLPPAIDVAQEVALVETQPVYIFGFPANRAPPGPGNPPITVGKGTISGLRRDGNNELTDIHINGEINPGNSGGPVIDAAGQLIGIAVATVPGKQIGFAIPAGEMNQMFKGRLSNAVVLRLEQKGTRLDAHGEVWVHDRKSNVRGRDVVTIRLPDVPKGSVVPADEYMVLARLADPMLKLRGASAYFTAAQNVPAKAPASGWVKIANATPVLLKMQDQFAIGSFKLPKGAIADQTYAIQFSYVNADAKTVFTEPHLVRLTFPKNIKSVTLTITEIPNLPTRRYLEDTVPTFFEGKVRIKSKTNDSLVVEIEPVEDPATIEPRIKFGKVTSVQGRTFTVSANKVVLPAPTAAEVTAALSDVKSTDRNRRIGGADRLAKAYVPLASSRTEVAKALAANVADKDIWVGNAALRALLIWGVPDNIAALAAGTENNFTRTGCLDVLAKFKDPAAAAALAKWLPNLGDRGRVSAALKAMGPLAEKAVIPFVTHMDSFTANEACNILKEIGTAECVPALTQVANSNNPFVSANARATLKIVQGKSGR